MGFSRQEDWSGLTFPPPGDLPNPAIEPMSPASPALAGEFFTTEPPEKPLSTQLFILNLILPVCIYVGDVDKLMALSSKEKSLKWWVSIDEIDINWFRIRNHHRYFNQNKI